MSREDRYPLNPIENILVAILAPLIALMMKLYNMTCRVVMVDGKEQERSAVGEHGGRAVYCSWHQRMFYQFHYYGKIGVTMMISRSRDGEWAARVAHYLGFKCVRGSSRKGDKDKGGKSALLKLIDEVKNGESAGLLVDGPSGPARQVKMGALVIARETGAPLIAEMYGCDRAWMLNSWDRYMIPKPFARICIIHGTPQYIPPDATDEQMEAHRLAFERELNEAAKRCDEYFGLERPMARDRGGHA